MKDDRNFKTSLQSLIDKGLLEMADSNQYRPTKLGETFFEYCDEADKQLNNYLNDVVKSAKLNERISYNPHEEIRKLHNSLENVPAEWRGDAIATVLTSQNIAEEKSSLPDYLFKKFLVRILYNYIYSKNKNYTFIKDLHTVYREICFSVEQPGYA